MSIDTALGWNRKWDKKGVPQPSAVRHRTQRKSSKLGVGAKAPTTREVREKKRSFDGPDYPKYWYWERPAAQGYDHLGADTKIRIEAMGQ